MCGNTHWKAAKAASKTLQHVSETGVMIGVCRHGIQLKALNMFQGEIFAYPMYLQYTFFNMPEMYFCQDIICKYWPYLKSIIDKCPTDQCFSQLSLQRPFLSVMHAKAHEGKCQVRTCI